MIVGIAVPTTLESRAARLSAVRNGSGDRQLVARDRRIGVRLTAVGGSPASGRPTLRAWNRRARA